MLGITDKAAPRMSANFPPQHRQKRCAEMAALYGSEIPLYLVNGNIQLDEFAAQIHCDDEILSIADLHLEVRPHRQ